MASSTFAASIRWRHSDCRMRSIERARADCLASDVLAGVALRHRNPPRRRRVHLRRRDCALQLDRGQARRTAQQTAVPRAIRPLRKTDARSTTSKRSANLPLDPPRGRRRITRASARRARPARGSSAFPAPSRARASTKFRTGRRSATLIELGGGVAGGTAAASRSLLGGAAGRSSARRARSMPLTFEDARAAGTTLGSGRRDALRRASSIWVTSLRRIAALLPR